MSSSRRSFLAGLSAAAASSRLLAQAPPRPAATPRPPVFEVRIDVINLTVSVTDPRGRYLTGLGTSDFAVYEDGVRQDLSLFTADRLPISLCLMVDCSASMDDKLESARQAARRFVSTLEPVDTAQIVQFNDRRTVLQDYTGDQTALDRAAGEMQAWGPTALHNALYVSLKELSRGKTQGELRRRAIVLLSDGEDTASLVSDEQVIELARRTEVAIYSISLRSGRPERRGQAFSQAAYLLTTLSRDTGGQIHFPTSINELETVYDRIAEELRSQYSLGYLSSNRRKDGKWRRIVVRIPSRENVLIRSKLGYFAPSS